MYEYKWSKTVIPFPCSKMWLHNNQQQKIKQAVQFLIKAGGRPLYHFKINSSIYRGFQPSLKSITGTLYINLDT